MSLQKAFVTGATGFVGGHLCERLRREGWHVRALVRAGSGRGILEACGCEFVEGDLTMTNVLARASEGCDAVFHVAGLTQSPNRAGFEESNELGTSRVVLGLERSGFDGRFVYVSSLAAGGPAVAGRLRREADPDEPISFYGASKLAGERAISARKRAFTSTIVRPGAIYGPRERGILQVFQGIARWGVALRLGSGVKLQMTHVDDVVEGIMRTLPKADKTPAIFYLTESRVWNYDEVMREVARQLARQVRIIPVPEWIGGVIGHSADFLGRLKGRAISPIGMDKIREIKGGAWIADTTKLRELTEWEPSIGFPEGLNNTLEWAHKSGKIT